MTPDELAKQVLEVVPPVMRAIRNQMREASSETLTVPQFRILACIGRGLNLVGEIARHQGVTQPAMSKMVNGLVQRGYVKRAPDGEDRRQVFLKLTKEGETLYREIRKSAQAHLSDKIAPFTEEDRSELSRGLAVLSKLFLGK